MIPASDESMTNDPTLLTELEFRLSAGIGPDRELDKALHRALLDDAGPREPWTASTDAALYLLMRIDADLGRLLRSAADDLSARASGDVLLSLPRTLLAHGIQAIIP